MEDSGSTNFFRLCLVLIITIVVSEVITGSVPSEAYAREAADTRLLAETQDSGLIDQVYESAMGAPATLRATTVAMNADTPIRVAARGSVSTTELNASAERAQEAIAEEERKAKEEAERKAAEEEERRRLAQARSAARSAQSTAEPARSASSDAGGDGYVGQFKLTAYCPCAKCCGNATGITATGTTATVGRTIAANPNILPFGTVIYVEGYGTYTVEDTGNLASYTLDVYFDSHQEALNFGVRYADVYIVE